MPAALNLMLLAAVIGTAGIIGCLFAIACYWHVLIELLFPRREIKAVCCDDPTVRDDHGARVLRLQRPGTRQ